MRRYDAFYGQLKAHLDSKTVGEPLVVNCVHRAPQAPGFSGDMALTDSCVHEYDVLRWLLEEDYASVQVITPKCTTQKTDEYQDPHIILLTTQSGTHISIESFVNCHYGYDIQCRVTGETGELTLPAPASVKVRDQGKYSSDILMDWDKRFTEAFFNEIQSWVLDCKKSEVNGPNAWDGYLVALTADACVKAKASKVIEPIVFPNKPDFYL